MTVGFVCVRPRPSTGCKQVRGSGSPSLPQFSLCTRLYILSIWGNFEGFRQRAAQGTMAALMPLAFARLSLLRQGTLLSTHYHTL